MDAVGAAVSGLTEGDRVAWKIVAGSYAEQVVANEDDVVKIPAAVATKTAAAVMLQGLTAHYLVNSTYPIREGDTCLIHAAAGGSVHNSIIVLVTEQSFRFKVVRNSDKISLDCLSNFIGKLLNSVSHSVLHRLEKGAVA